MKDFGDERVRDDDRSMGQRFVVQALQLLSHRVDELFNDFWLEFVLTWTEVIPDQGTQNGHKDRLVDSHQPRGMTIHAERSQIGGEFG